MNQPASRFVAGRPQLHYLEWNPTAARIVVLLHGNSANAWWWQPLAQVVGEDLRLLALDLRGHGDSEWVRPPAYSPADYADDLFRLLRAAGGARGVVVGHSMGAGAVAVFALDYPQLVNGAAVIDAAVSSSARRRRYLAHLRALPTVIYPDLATAKARFRLMPDEGGIPPALLAEIAEHSIRRIAGGYTMKFDRQSFFGSDGLDMAAALRAVRVPLLLVRAERSRILTAEDAATAARSNRLVALATVPGAHHLPLESPASLGLALDQFIRRACG